MSNRVSSPREVQRPAGSLAALQRPILSIVVVSYNTRAMTLACLQSIADETTTPHEVIVIDNGSVDGSPLAIAERFPDVQLYRLRHNIGFARANNVAARVARGRFILLLNPDTVVLERAIDNLLAFAQRVPDAKIWGGRTIFDDGRLNTSSCWARMTVWNQFCRMIGATAILPRTTLFNGEAYGGWRRDSERAVDIVSGCFLLIERSFWNTLEGFNAAYFMYGEEADLCLRARAFGARPRITPNARIVHHGGASETTRFSKMVKLLRAKATLARTHSGYAAPLVLAFMAAWPLTRWLALTTVGRLLARDVSVLNERASTWKAIWLHRRHWLRGYDTGLTPRDPHLGLMLVAGAKGKANRAA
ncbi:MAG: glycosyltransferase family 2 protein [Pseudomonadota bacterium]